MGAPSLEALGSVFVLSGGVHRNAAAVKAQIDYLEARHPKARIRLHPFPGEAGAIGAALAARGAVRSTTRFIGFDRAIGRRFSATSDSSTRCRLCPSECRRTIVAAASPGVDPPLRLATGYGCDRGAELEDRLSVRRPGSSSATRRARNLLRHEAERLFSRAAPVRVASSAGKSLRIAIPRVLSMYRSAPFFTHYFEAIGVDRDDLVIGDLTSEALWRRGAGRGSVDACFPAKVVNAHVAALLAGYAARPFDVLFFPLLTHAITAVAGTADTASCPVVAGTPLVTRAAFLDANALPAKVALLTPTLVLTTPERFADQLFDAVKSIAPGLTRSEHAEAVVQGRAGQRAFEDSLEREGTAELARALAERRAAIVMLGRPYHADPGLHHDIGSELAALGRATLSIRALPKVVSRLAAAGCDGSFDAGAGAEALTNSGDGEKLAAARVVATHPYLVAMEVSSFKCGQDASLYGAVEEIARHGGRPFLALHDLDETRPISSLRLRLRTFLDAIEAYERTLAERASTGVER